MFFHDGLWSSKTSPAPLQTVFWPLCLLPPVEILVSAGWCDAGPSTCLKGESLRLFNRSATSGITKVLISFATCLDTVSGKSGQCKTKVKEHRTQRGLNWEHRDRTGSELLAAWAGGWRSRTCCQSHTAGSVPRVAAQQETAWEEKDATDVTARSSQSSGASERPSLQAGKFCPRLPLCLVLWVFLSRTYSNNGFLLTGTRTQSTQPHTHTHTVQKRAAVAVFKLTLPPYVAVIQLPGGSYHRRCTCWTCAIQTLAPSVPWPVARGPPHSQPQNTKVRSQTSRCEKTFDQSVKSCFSGIIPLPMASFRLHLHMFSCCLTFKKKKKAYSCPWNHLQSEIFW